MHGMRGPITCLACAAILACAAVRADVFPDDGIITEPAPDNFSVCLNYSCNTVRNIALTGEQWNSIGGIFSPPARTASEEREHIAAAVGRMEAMIGALTGTDADRGGTFPAIGRNGQMDCIDESINTTTYLSMIQRAGMLHFHTVADRATRGLVILRWPHTTAVIREQGNGDRFAVDSWFLDNGEPPFVVPLKAWRRGWTPGS